MQLFISFQLTVLLMINARKCYCKDKAGATENVARVKTVKKTVVLVVAACGPRLAETMVLLKSAIMFTEVPLIFHIFADDDLRPQFKKELDAWPSWVKKKMKYHLHEMSFPSGQENDKWRKLFKLCASQRVFIPDLLTGTDAALYVDTDILFQRSLADIWAHFDLFNATQMVALTPEHEPDFSSAGWYNRHARHPYYPPLGLNSGVMLMNLTRMRAANWTTMMTNYYQKYRLDIVWGDQDLINIYFHFHPQSIYVYPCHWNYRPDHCMYGSNCHIAHTEGISVLHGNRRAFHLESKRPMYYAFMAVYNAFRDYTFGEDMKTQILDVIPVNMVTLADQTACGRISHVFLIRLRKQLKKIQKREKKAAEKKERLTGQKSALSDTVAADTKGNQSEQRSEKTVKPLEDEATQSKDEATLLKNEAIQLKAEATNMKDAAAQLKEEATVLKDEATQRNDEATQMNDEAAQLNNDATRLKEERAQLKDETIQLNDEATQLKDEAIQLKAEATLLKNEAIQLKAEATKMKDAAAQLKEEATVLKDEATQRNDEATQMNDEAAQLNNDATRLKEERAQLKDETIQLNDEATQLKDEAIQLKAEATKMKDAAAQLKEEATVLKDEATQRNDEATQMNDEAAQLNNDATQLKEERAQLKDETIQLNDEATQLKDEAVQLKYEATLLKNDAIQLKAEATNMKDAAAQLKEVATVLKDETTQRNDEATQMNDEAAQLNNDATQLKEERSQLKDETIQLNDEATQLKDEAIQLKYEATLLKDEVTMKKPTTVYTTEDYSNEQQSDRRTLSRRRPIILSVVACGEDRLQETLVMLKSAVLFMLKSAVPLHFIVFADDELRPMFETELSSWPDDVRCHFTYSLRPINYPVDAKSVTRWQQLFAPCASQRLFFPQILTDVDSVLYVDTDMLFLRPLDDLWAMFDEFSLTQLAMLTPEHEDAHTSWYKRFARHPYYPPLGLNSGVMLMNLTRMRAADWVRHMVDYYEEYRLNITWGDQDLINIFFHFYPEKLFLMSCEWNFRPDHCMYMSVCREAELGGASVLHGCRRVFHNDKQPAFRAVYEALRQHEFGADVSVSLLPAVRRHLQLAPHSQCGKIEGAFTLQLEKQAVGTSPNNNEKTVG